MEFFDDFTKPYIFLSGAGMLVEGTVKISVWQADCIILQAREKIKIIGQELCLDYKGQGTLLVRGKIFGMEFLSC